MRVRGRAAERAGVPFSPPWVDGATVHGEGTPILESPRSRWIAGIVSVAVVLAGVGIGVAWTQFRSFDTVELDPSGARERLQSRGGADDGELLDPITRNDEFLTTLILGSDAREGLGGSRADAIILVVMPPGDDVPVMTSVPRDLWVPNPCTGGMSRINAGLNGCGSDVSGPDLMTVMVEDLAGIEIDHFVELEFEGFIRIIDAVGGIEICTENPIRDHRAELSLPGGCVQADGDTALGWVRSRNPQELVDGTWRPQAGVTALTRDERQQDVLLSVVGKVSEFGSIGTLRSRVAGLQDAVILDSGMSFTRAVGLAWDIRGLDTEDVERVTLPVTGFTTSGGAQVLRAEASLNELLLEALGRDPDESPGSAD